MCSCSNSMDGSCPSSPAEDRASKRLSWGHLLQKLIEVKGANHRLSAEDCSSSETGSLSGDSMSEFESSVFCDPCEERLASEVVATIALILQDPSQKGLGCSKLILTKCLLENIRQELLHLAVSEPCGLRGAIIDLCVEQNHHGDLCRVDQLAVDPSVVPTFHITLALRPETGGLWPKVRKLFKGSKTPHTTTGNGRQNHALKLSTGFRAIKRKLYCSGDLLVEECC